jgi:hypothetical protein
MYVYFSPFVRPMALNSASTGCFKFAAIFNAAMLLVIAFCLPETLYVRRLPSPVESKHDSSTMPMTKALKLREYISLLRPWRTFPGLTLRLDKFVLPSLKMARYPSVLFPAVYYAVQYGLASILPGKC